VKAGIACGRVANAPELGSDGRVGFRKREKGIGFSDSHFDYQYGNCEKQTETLPFDKNSGQAQPQGSKRLSTESATCFAKERSVSRRVLGCRTVASRGPFAGMVYGRVANAPERCYSLLSARI